PPFHGGNGFPMAVPTTRRTSSGGGSPLIILGIVLALATGALVFYLINGGGGGGPTAAVFTAARGVAHCTILTTDPNKKDDGYMQVADAFHVQQLPDSLVPSDALKPTDPNWSSKLNGQAIQESITAGDIIHIKGDLVTHMQALAGGPLGSLAGE